MNPWTLCLSVLVTILSLLPLMHTKHVWENPGCYKVGHTRRVQIPGCLSFEVPTNACRGYCKSYAIPSLSHTLATNPNYLITSRAECCSIVDTHDVKVRVRCMDGFREVVFKSAKTCECSICRLG